jgi:hypothetical protein
VPISVVGGEQPKIFQKSAISGATQSFEAFADLHGFFAKETSGIFWEGLLIH